MLEVRHRARARHCHLLTKQNFGTIYTKDPYVEPCKTLQQVHIMCKRFNKIVAAVTVISPTSKASGKDMQGKYRLNEKHRLMGA